MNQSLTNQQVAEFHKNGFLAGGRVLSDDQLTELNEALHRVTEGKSEAKPDALRNIGSRSDESVVIQIVNIWEQNPPSNPIFINRKSSP